jgi:hypothetical protein
VLVATPWLLSGIRHRRNTGALVPQSGMLGTQTPRSKRLFKLSASVP